MLNTRWTGPDPVPELAGTPVRMAAAVKDDAGRGTRVVGECSSDRSGLDDVQRIVVDDPLDVLRRPETFLQLFGDLSQRTGMDGSKWSFERFRNIFRLVQPKPLGCHFTFYQLFAISLDVLDENGLPSIRPGKAREHDSRALGAQETLDDDRHRRYLRTPISRK